MELQELSMQEIEQVSAGSLTSAGYGAGAATSAAVGFGFFGPVGAVAAFGAYSAGFAAGTIYHVFVSNRNYLRRMGEMGNVFMARSPFHSLYGRSNNFGFSFYKRKNFKKSQLLCLNRKALTG
jgi:hypothetical protein